MSVTSIRLHPSRKRSPLISTIDTIPLNNYLSVPNTLNIIFRCKKNGLKNDISLQTKRARRNFTHSHSLTIIIANIHRRIKKKGKSGGGWVLALENDHHLIEGFNPNFGQSNQITSYRSEAYTVLYVTLFLHHYCNFFGVPLNITITAGCDNPALVDKLTWFLEDLYHQSNLHNETDSEILRIILNIVPAKYKIIHVYGYQDEKIPYEKLPIDAKLNVDSDRYSTTNKKTPFNKNINSYPFSIYIKGKYAHHHSYENIRKKSHVDEAQDWLRSKDSWLSKEFQIIDWDNHSKVLNTQPASQRRFSLRFIHRHLPIGAQKFDMTQSYPYCKKEQDLSQDHFIQCLSNPKGKEQRLKKLRYVMHRLNTPPDLLNMIIYHTSRY